MKKSYSDNSEYSQKLAFLEEEILKSKAPRTFLIETVLSSMVDQSENEFAELKELIDEKLLEKA
ncbi:hypothetical protein [Mesobacillus subterraneus]|uniref:Uncharacterized protein n=1 Tax=Mesobacillus subterraneus TaxID=285983 RepID=A0A3R9DRG0_9BACI|nr:hypothetical protein [Mesobacillus subterraneus]RSD25579.1 hypothetical protein EJA10_17435 [Mesobacillus subterraneus]